MLPKMPYLGHPKGKIPLSLGYRYSWLGGLLGLLSWWGSCSESRVVGALGRGWVHREKSEEKAASRWRVVWEGCSEEWGGKKLGQLGLDDRKRGTP